MTIILSSNSMAVSIAQIFVLFCPCLMNRNFYLSSTRQYGTEALRFVIFLLFFPCATLIHAYPCFLQWIPKIKLIFKHLRHILTSSIGKNWTTIYCFNEICTVWRGEYFGVHSWNSLVNQMSCTTIFLKQIWWWVQCGNATQCNSRMNGPQLKNTCYLNLSSHFLSETHHNGNEHPRTIRIQCATDGRYLQCGHPCYPKHPKCY